MLPPASVRACRLPASAARVRLLVFLRGGRFFCCRLSGCVTCGRQGGLVLVSRVGVAWCGVIGSPTDVGSGVAACSGCAEVGGSSVLLLGVVASLSTAAISLPQVARTLRVSSTAGVSGPMWLLLNLTFSVWLVWGVLSGDVFVVVTNLAALPGGLWVLWRVVRDGGLSWRSGVAALVFGVLLVPLQVLAGVGVSLVVVVMLTLVTRSLQGWKLFRSEDVSGVSLFPWLVGSFSQLCWLWYGLAVGNVVVAAHAPVAVAANMALVVAVVLRRSVHAG